MAMRVGAQLGNMREAWWAPVVTLPGLRADGAPNGLLTSRERALPGSIMVNGYGHRFANEAANYNAFGGAYHVLDASRFEYPNLPSYLIFGQSVVDRFGVFGGAAGASVPDWVLSADTLDELAALLGIPAPALKMTVERFNRSARSGVDPDFGRGESAYDRFPGGRMLDPSSRSATLGPVEGARFYGVEIESSALGTKGGPRTDADGRVLDVDDSSDPRPLRGGQRDGQPDRDGLRRRRRNARGGGHLGHVRRRRGCARPSVGRAQQLTGRHS